MSDRTALIRAAADWLTRQPVPPSPVVPSLRREFGLTPSEAVEAIRLHQTGDRPLERA